MILDLSPCDASGGHPNLLVVLPELVHDVGTDPGPGGGDWVTHGDGATAGVELLQGKVELLLAGQHLIEKTDIKYIFLCGGFFLVPELQRLH